ncbi:PREDICTED: uncharacterized protein LOC104822545 [Tarenaya hassleriana]|uniref:uncharacterized protein LOC104822545 n=1 Tax=Tarenaya hassleriana TaxID=28532 RepID=UPI00053C30ED|nr:PREDICTED: uncharacterized protein LOC104822545 [Tarenaya hassleriana]
MEGSDLSVVPVVFNGENYFYWSKAPKPCYLVAVCGVILRKENLSPTKQNGEPFTKLHSEFNVLWAELEELRPLITDLKVLTERMEQDKVFSFLLTLDRSYNDLVYHILRNKTLPAYNEVCMLIKREEGRKNLFAVPSEFAHYHKTECSMMY